MHHAQVRVAEARVVVHDGRRLGHHADVARLFLELAHGGLFGGFARVDEAGGDLDDDLVDGWAVLLLQDNLLARGLVEDGDDANAIDVCAGGASASFSGFPGSLGAFGVLVRDAVEGNRKSDGRTDEPRGSMGLYSI